MDKDQIDYVTEPCVISDDTININISDSELSSFAFNSDDVILDTISMANTNYSVGSTGAVGSSWGNVTINTSGSGYNGSWSSINNSVLTSSAKAGLHVTSNAEFDGDVKIKGVSILETLEKIEKRLMILKPDPEKLEHFEALKKAYEHYKTLEALCELPSKEEEK